VAGSAQMKKIVAIPSFDSMEAIGAAFGSKEGQSTAADLANFA
jgi:hypothetical protein